jgi:signal transduction histidine kinase/CheY-like chemotaxis protein
VLSGSGAVLASRAIGAKDLVTDLVDHPGNQASRLAFAISVPGGIVVYEQFEVNPAQLTASQESSPFSELQGAVYAAPTADRSKLLFSTATHVPLTGTIDQQVLHIGADRWLLVASARQPLVGGFASKTQWIILALGLLTSFIAFAAAEILLRRRRYALALVDDRTATLRRTLTDLETARASAEAANLAKSEFLSRMSHELRTPLNAVLGFAQVLELGELTEGQQQSVTQIAKGGQHLLELINEVLDIARIETGNLSLSAEPVLVADIVDDVLDLIEPLANQRNIRCSVGDGCDAGFVLADRQRLKQVLLNLVKYNEPGGTVTISSNGDDDTVRIAVTDTGPGIPEDQHDLLFEPFERLGAELTNTEGAGVGLALSRRLTEAMNGVLAVNSTVGEGSTFWLELQRAEGPVEYHQRTTAAGPRLTSPEISTDSARRTVLYIEDNLANVKLIEHIFDHQPNIEVVAAMQGRLGIELAQQHRPALILLDLHLPDMNGEKVLTELRADSRLVHTPIFVLTADATDRQAARLVAAGATAYITKPIDVQQLLTLVNDTLVEAAAHATRRGTDRPEAPEENFPADRSGLPQPASSSTTAST